MEYLKTDKGTRNIKDSILQSQMQGISGVPNFTIDNKYVVRESLLDWSICQLFIFLFSFFTRYTLSGAQQPETFLEVFEEVGKRLADA